MTSNELIHMNDMEIVDKDDGRSRTVRRVTVALTGIVTAAAIVTFKDHPDSMAITIGGFFTFLLVFRLAGPARRVAL